MAANALNNLAKGAIGIGAGVSLFQASIYNVDGGYRAVMFNRLSGVQVCAPLFFLDAARCRQSTERRASLPPPQQQQQRVHYRTGSQHPKALPLA